MKIKQDKLNDRLSIVDLTSEEYAVLMGALKMASMDASRPEHEYTLLYNAAHSLAESLCNVFREAERLN